MFCRGPLITIFTKLGLITEDPSQRRITAVLHSIPARPFQQFLAFIAVGIAVLAYPALAVPSRSRKSAKPATRG